MITTKAKQERHQQPFLLEEKDPNEKENETPCLTPQDIHLILTAVARTARQCQLAESTIRKKLVLLRLTLSHLPSLTAEGLNHFFQHYRTRKGTPLRPNTRNAIRKELAWLFRHVLKVDLPPSLQQALQCEPETTPGTTIRPQELEELLKYAPNQAFYLAFKLIHAAGLRPHEVLSLTPEGIEFSSPDIAIIHLPEKNPKVPSGKNKTGRRPVLVLGETARLLQEYLRSRHWLAATAPSSSNIPDATNHDRFLFPFAHHTLSTVFCRMKRQHDREWHHRHHASSHQGPRTPQHSSQPSEGSNTSSPTPDSPSAVSPTRTSAAASSPLRSIRLYDLRHSAATTLAIIGLPDQLLRRTLGWSPDSAMPATYIHVTASDLVSWGRQHRHVVSSHDRNDEPTGDVDPSPSVPRSPAVHVTRPREASSSDERFETRVKSILKQLSSTNE